MPILSMFYGIIVKMYKEKNGKHHKPHIHAEYQGDEIVVGLDGEILEGNIQNKRKTMLLAWMAIHEEELYADWKLLSDYGEYFKIEPLK